VNIKIDNITKSFNDKEVLKGITIEAISGKAVGLLGRNGAGKTTTIRIIMGVIFSDSGEISVDGKTINRNTVTIGYLPEERGLYPKRTVLEQIVYFGRLRGMNKADAIKSAKYWLDRVGMTEYSNKNVITLSKGNQQKIQIAVTLVHNPDIVILDEPFSGLDPVNAAILKGIVKECIDNNKIVIFSSHQMNYIEEFCNDIVIINGGKIVLSGNINDIKKSYDRTKIMIVSSNPQKIKDELSEESHIENGVLIVKLNNEGDKKQLFLKLSNIDVDIDEIKVYEPSLNDIFVEYTEAGL